MITDDDPIEAARCPSCGQTKCPECDESRKTEDLRRALDLLHRVADASTQAPDPERYRDYFLHVEYLRLLAWYGAIRAKSGAKQPPGEE